MFRIRRSCIFNSTRVRNRVVQTAKGQLRQVRIFDCHEEIRALRLARTGTAVQHGSRRGRGVSTSAHDCMVIASVGGSDVDESLVEK